MNVLLFIGTLSQLHPRALLYNLYLNHVQYDMSPYLIMEMKDDTKLEIRLDYQS